MRLFLLSVLTTIGVLTLAGSAVAIPGDNSKFTLVGAAFRDHSPTNPDDQVIRFTVSSPDDSTAGVIRKVNQSVNSLDGELFVDYYFVAPKTCGGGSPRYSLFIDENANGVWEPALERAVFGYIGPGPFGTACQTDTWRHENLTDDFPRWDLSQFGVAGLQTWEAVKLFFNTRPGQNNMVVFAKLVDDSCGFATCGTAYYDTIGIGDRDLTLENWNNSTTGCSKEFESSGSC